MAPRIHAGEGATRAPERRAPAAEKTGEVKGTILFLGEVPEAKPIDVRTDPDVCGAEEILPQTLLVAEGGAVRNAVAWLEGVEGGRGLSTEEVAIDQKGCVFDPHVSVVGVGQPIRFLNSDPVVHNVRTIAKMNMPLNFSIPGKGLGRPVKKEMRFPEVIKVKCDVHRWMTCWIVVRDNAYWSQTGEDGKFSIDGVPPGKYKLVVWHESLKRVETEVEVAAGAVVESEFEMEGKAPPKRRRRKKRGG